MKFKKSEEKIKSALEKYDPLMMISRLEKLEAIDKKPFYLSIAGHGKNFLNKRSRLLDLSKFISMHMKK